MNFVDRLTDHSNRIFFRDEHHLRKKANLGNSLRSRTIHGIIAGIEYVPVVGPIVSIVDIYIVEKTVIAIAKRKLRQMNQTNRRADEELTDPLFFDTFDDSLVP